MQKATDWNFWIQFQLKIGMLLNQQKRKELERNVEQEIQEAIDFAEKSDFPSLMELYTDVFQD